MKVLIIGGGPAGMIAAITAKKNYPEADVEILEKNSSLGKKLLITGNLLPARQFHWHELP